jgi:hypothetical protein
MTAHTKVETKYQTLQPLQIAAEFVCFTRSPISLSFEQSLVPVALPEMPHCSAKDSACGASNTHKSMMSVVSPGVCRTPEPLKMRLPSCTCWPSIALLLHAFWPRPSILSYVRLAPSVLFRISRSLRCLQWGSCSLWRLEPLLLQH